MAAKHPQPVKISDEDRAKMCALLGTIIMLYAPSHEEDFMAVGSIVMYALVRENPARSPVEMASNLASGVALGAVTHMQENARKSGVAKSDAATAAVIDLIKKMKL